MTEETAKALIEALNRFSGVLEKIQGGGSFGSALGAGIHVHHHGLPQQQFYPSYQPSYSPFVGGHGTGGMNQ